MPIVESRVKDGTLTLGTVPTDFSCQVTNIRINSAYSDDGDPLETLCGDTIPAGRKKDSRSLAGTFVQDWSAPEASSLTKYLFAHDLETVDFEYVPNAAADTISGQVRVEVPGETWGGDVNTRITSDFEWFMIGEPVFTAPAGFSAMSLAELQAAAAAAGVSTSGTKADLIERLESNGDEQAA
jgi:SAP domain